MVKESQAPKPNRTRGGKNWQRLGYRRIVQLLVYLVIFPTVLLLSIGIISMFLEGRINLLLGLLIVTFVAVVGIGVVLVIVFVSRQANLSELQADFVSKVSHEFRTPLTAIKLFAETIERSHGDRATQDKCLHLLLEESERLSRLIERLLDWGRMEEGRKLYDLQPESVELLVDDALVAFEHATYQSDLSISKEIAPNLPKVMVDRAAMADALANLLSNALKYGGTPPHIVIKAYVDSRGDVVVEVKDNGDGIELSEQRRIFDKFYRIDDRLSRTREGSGLGLAIVKHVARAHDARIVLTSSKGHGSTFAIVLSAAPSAKISPP